MGRPTASSKKMLRATKAAMDIPLQNRLCCSVNFPSSRFECFMPVSYTHLDVYKRQTLLRDLLTSSGDGRIAKIDLDCTDAGDASRMFKYMLEGA